MNSVGFVGIGQYCGFSDYEKNNFICVMSELRFSFLRQREICVFRLVVVAAAAAH
jgi:hypothetical protein